MLQFNISPYHLSCKPRTMLLHGYTTSVFQLEMAESSLLYSAYGCYHILVKFQKIHRAGNGMFRKLWWSRNSSKQCLSFTYSKIPIWPVVREQPQPSMYLILLNCLTLRVGSFTTCFWSMSIPNLHRRSSHFCDRDHLKNFFKLE